MKPNVKTLVGYSQNECVRKMKPKRGVKASFKRLLVIELTDFLLEPRLEHLAVSIEVESTRPILEDEKTFFGMQFFLFF